MDQVSFETGYFLGPNEIFDHQETDVYEKLVYLYLCRCANNSAAAFPSYNTIADKCSMSRRKAVDTIKSLIDKRLLSKTVRYGEDKNQSNLYKVLPASAPPAPPAVHSMHHPSAQDAPPLVQDMHHPSAHHAPYKELSINNQFINKSTTTAMPTESEMIAEKTVGDIYTEVFGNLQMPATFRKYFLNMKAVGVSDQVFCEAMLEAAESASGKPNQRFLDSILQRWIKEGIQSRAAAQQHKTANVPARSQYRRQQPAAKPKPEIVSKPAQTSAVSDDELAEVLRMAEEMQGGAKL